MTLPSLIAQLMGAREGSAELDLKIWRAVSREDWRWVSQANETITVDRYGPGAVGNPVLSLDRFSRSIDDALALVPAIWRWKIAHSGVGKGTVRVELWTIHYVRSGPTQVKTKGYTAPLAICSAALQIPATLSTPEQAA